MDQVEKIFQRFDKNHDDALTDEEIMPYFVEKKITNEAMFREWFDSVDTDHNNTISKQELFVFLKSQQYQEQSTEEDDWPCLDPDQK